MQWQQHYSSNTLRPVASLRIIYLGVPKLILCVIHIDRPQELLSSFLVVNELSLRYHTSIQYFVPIRQTLVREWVFFLFFEVSNNLTSASNLCLKSPYRILLGKPFLQILIPSSTPLHRS